MLSKLGNTVQKGAAGFSDVNDRATGDRKAEPTDADHNVSICLSIYVYPCYLYLSRSTSHCIILIINAFRSLASRAARAAIKFLFSIKNSSDSIAPEMLHQMVSPVFQVIPPPASYHMCNFHRQTTASKWARGCEGP